MNEKLNFNKILYDCVKDKDFVKLDNNINAKSIKKLEKDYDATFDTIHAFRKSFTKKRLDDYVSVYQSYLNKFESNGENGSNTDGYKYYKFVSSPQAVVLLDFGRVKFSDIKGNKNPTVPPD